MDLPRMNFFFVTCRNFKNFFFKTFTKYTPFFFIFFVNLNFDCVMSIKKKKKMPTRIVALHPFTTRSQTQLLPRRSRNSATPPQQPLHPLFFSLFLSPPSSFFFKKKKTKNKKKLSFTRRGSRPFYRSCANVFFCCHRKFCFLFFNSPKTIHLNEMNRFSVYTVIIFLKRNSKFVKKLAN